MTDPILKNPREVMWISHRGYRERCLDNTLEAFQSAVEQGFQCLETDLRITKDNHIVLSHDRFLDALGGPPGIPVDSLTRDELCAVNLRGGGKLLFFDEFMHHFGELCWIFDIKPESGQQVLACLGDWITKANAATTFAAQARFLLWRRDNHRHLAQVLPHARVLAGRDACWRAGLSVWLGLPQLGGIKADRTYALSPTFMGRSLYTQKFIEAYHRRGAKVLAYLPVHDDDVKKALVAGVDEVLTNYGRGG